MAASKLRSGAGKVTGNEEVADADAADATAFCTTVASIRNTKKVTIAFCGEKLLLQLLLQLRAAHWLQQSQNSNPN